MSSSFRVGAISAAITLDNNPFKQGIRESIKEATSLRTTFKAMREDLTSVGRDLSLAGGAITAFFAGTVKAAADVEEAENLFVVSMGSMADSTRAWSEELAVSLRLNANSIRQVAGGLNVVIGNMGLTTEASTAMSKEMTKLAFDMGSFYNLPHEAALEKLRAGILGESEPLKQLGIVLNEAKVQAFAWANGIGKAGQDLNEQQKVVARYGLIMQQTTLAQGDLARTGGSATNQFRQLKEQILAVGQNIGKDLLPPVTQFLARANEAVNVLRNWAKSNTETAASMTKIAAGTGLAIFGIGSMALGVVGLARAFDVLKKAAIIAWTVVNAPIVPWIAAIAAVGVAIYALRATWQQNFAVIGSVSSFYLDGVKGKFTELGNWALGIVQQIKDGFVAAMGHIGGAASKLLAFVGVDTGGWGAATKGWFGEVADGAEMAVNKVKDYFSGVPAYLGGIVASTKKQLKEDFSGLPPELKGLVDGLKASMSTPAFEGYNPLDLEGLMKGAQTMGDLEGATKKAGEAAKKAAEEMKRLKEEASDMRLELFPKEGFSDAAAHITKLATLFPQIMTGDAVQKGFQNLFTEFETKGVSAAKLLEAGMLAIPKKFIPAMQEAAAAAQVAILESMMEARAEITDSDHWSKVGDLKARGKDRYTSLMDPAGIAEMTKDTVALTAHLQDLVSAGKMSAGEVDNILSLDHWEKMRQLAGQSFEGIAESIRSLISAGQSVPKDMFAAINKASWKEMGTQIGNVGESLKGLGVNAIGGAISGMGKLFSIGADLGKILKQTPGLFQSMEIAGVSAAIKLGTALHIALNVISLIADAVTVVLELFGAWGDEGVKELKGMAKVIDEIKEASDQWIDSLTDKLVDAIKTGQFAWRDFVNEVLDDLTRIAVRELVVSPIADFAGGLLGFADGGAFEKGHVVRSPEMFNTKSGPAVRGEAGTEVVMPAVRLRDGTLGVKGAGGGSAAPIININDYRSNDSPPIEVSHRRGPDGQDIYDIVVNAFNKAAAVGDLDRALNLTQMRRGSF